MCGIIGYNGKKEAISIVIKGLKNLEYRGYDSSGIAYFKNKEIKIIKEKGRISELEKLLEKDTANLCIGHTRWATHGKPSRINSHPHRVGEVTIVHNGIIENYASLKEELINLGYKFQSETDTEVACALIDHLYSKEKDKLKVLNELETKLKGSYALLILFSDEDTIYAIRKGSPLIVASSLEGNFVASDIPAILDYTKNYYLLDEGEIAVIKKDSVKFYKEDKEIKKKLLTFEFDISSAKKEGYKHFMLKEIHEQPKVIKNFLEHYLNNLDLLPDLDGYKKIHIVACGSAYHAGLIGSFLFEEYGNIEVNCYVASEYRYKKNFLDKKTLVILISQSGETADTIASLRLAREMGAKTLGIVNTVGSTIARESDKVIYINAGCEIAVATTKAYTLQVLTLSLCAFKLGIKKGLIDSKEQAELENAYLKLPREIDDLLKIDYKKYAKKIYNHQNAFFIGRLIDYYITLEGSLKLKEISYIHSETYAAGELKHGTISLISEGTPVIAVITDKRIAEKTISNIKEVRARGAYTLVLKQKNIEISPDNYDDLISIETLSDLVSAILSIIPLQMLAYETADLLGYDIDKPRNLAKSVTVE